MNNLLASILLFFLGVGLFYWGILSIRKDKKGNDGISPFSSFGTDLRLTILGGGVVLMSLINIYNMNAGIFLEFVGSVLSIVIGMAIKRKLIVVNYALEKRWWVFVVIGVFGILLEIAKLIFPVN